ncbi:MAG: HDOD domain-containing protein [Verrucomicrobiales bacterium]|nr:HDOD domain-containing protein [Verrucomicrobiales bacterium]
MEKILFVDDDPNLLEACRRQLRKRFAVETAVDPAAGLTLIEHNGPFAVVVSDLRMAGNMDGIEFLSEAQRSSYIFRSGTIKISKRISEGMNSKKRILFVDDEALVLQGLQRMLRQMRNDWELEFVDSGAKALERMAQVNFDVIISDMCMPGMNGAQLLNEVMQRCPKTIRLILSGQADKEMILKCVGAAHQFLSKPCDAEALKLTIRRASSLEALLQNENLRRLIAQMDRLPSVPTVYSQLIQVLQDPDANLEQVGDIIATDIAMTAKVLKLVNSAFFGLRRELSSPAEAALYLGLDTIRALVLSIHAFSQFESLNIVGFSLEALWGHSMEAAAAAKWIAQCEHGEARLCDEAFVAGMLHDMGKLILAANFPKEFHAALRTATLEHLQDTAAEKKIFGASHADVGGYLLGLWGLPGSVVEAVALHHSPAESVEKSFGSLTAVHVAEALIHERDVTEDAAGSRQVDEEYLATLGLSDRLKVWRADLEDRLQTAKAV